jgi:hypothetical protein
MGRLQFWLQGHGYPPPYRPWVMVWIGNQISSARYWWWRARGGEKQRVQKYSEFYVLNYSHPNATSNFTVDSESNAQSQEHSHD